MHTMPGAYPQDSRPATMQKDDSLSKSSTAASGNRMLKCIDLAILTITCPNITLMAVLWLLVNIRIDSLDAPVTEPPTEYETEPQRKDNDVQSTNRISNPDLMTGIKTQHTGPYIEEQRNILTPDDFCVQPQHNVTPNKQLPGVDQQDDALTPDEPRVRRPGINFDLFYTISVTHTQSPTPAQTHDSAHPQQHRRNRTIMIGIILDASITCTVESEGRIRYGTLDGHEQHEFIQKLDDKLTQLYVKDWWKRQDAHCAECTWALNLMNYPSYGRLAYNLIYLWYDVQHSAKPPTSARHPPIIVNRPVSTVSTSSDDADEHITLQTCYFDETTSLPSFSIRVASACAINSCRFRVISHYQITRASPKQVWLPILLYSHLTRPPESSRFTAPCQHKDGSNFFLPFSIQPPTLISDDNDDDTPSHLHLTPLDDLSSRLLLFDPFIIQGLRTEPGLEYHSTHRHHLRLAHSNLHLGIMPRRLALANSDGLPNNDVVPAHCLTISTSNNDDSDAVSVTGTLTRNLFISISVASNDGGAGAALDSLLPSLSSLTNVTTFIRDVAVTRSTGTGPRTSAANHQHCPGTLDTREQREFIQKLEPRNALLYGFVYTYGIDSSNEEDYAASDHLPTPLVNPTSVFGDDPDNDAVSKMLFDTAVTRGIGTGPRVHAASDVQGIFPVREHRLLINMLTSLSEPLLNVIISPIKPSISLDLRRTTIIYVSPTARHSPTVS